MEFQFRIGSFFWSGEFLTADRWLFLHMGRTTGMLWSSLFLLRIARGRLNNISRIKFRMFHTQPATGFDL
jgi:hypothetical protein